TNQHVVSIAEATGASQLSAGLVSMEPMNCRALCAPRAQTLRMLIKLAVAALDKSPFLRRLLWRWWYGRLAKKFTQRSWTFMNYGYEQEEGAAALTLDPDDEADRLCVQLYEQVVANVALQGRDAVEVGSGRGGGASYLARTHRPARYTGVDFSANAVALCRRA